jgi:peptidoglycan hydrolase-like protein with peptidoglycan-binding domain
MNGIRGPSGPKAPEARAPVDRQVQNLARALLDSGIARTPAEAMKMARALLQATAGKAVPNAALPDVIKLFQKDAGLPETGSFDRETKAALVDAGFLEPGDVDGNVHAPSTDGASAAGGAGGAQKKPTDGIDRTVRTFRRVTGEKAALPSSQNALKGGDARHRVAIEGAKERAELARPTSLRDDMKDLAKTLGQLGFTGRGQGAERLRTQIREAQSTLGLPVTGKLDDRTKAALEAFAQNPPASARDARRERSAGHSPTGVERRGASPAEARSEARGQAAHDDKATALADTRAQDASVHVMEQGQAFIDEGNRSGLEGEDGNAPAGDDERDDARRGHATLDDEEEHERGHYEVPHLSRQIVEALEGIVRDDDGRGPPSYAWDVTFYKPGVYGAGQPAEPLWHIGLAHTSPFDDVWREAARVLGDRLATLEPEARAPTTEDFERALRRARYRDDV